MLIRFYYEPSYSEEAFRWRLTWMREKVLPRIFAQRGAPRFDVCLWVHPRHRDEIAAIDPRIRTFDIVPGTPIMARHRWSRVRGLPRYDVQLRLDADDLISPDYVATALARLARMKAPRALVFFQPYKVDVGTGEVFWCAPSSGRGAYGPQKVSAFCALRQPTTARGYEWVYGLGHTKLFRFVDQVAAIPEGHCWAACHGFNDTTEVYAHDRRIGTLALN